MGASIDERVVEMKFDSAQFESGIKDSIKSLDELKQSLDLNTAATKFNSALKVISGIWDVTKGIASAFKNAASSVKNFALQITGLGSLWASQQSKMMSFVSEITGGAMASGFQEYELKMNSVRTIFSNVEKDGKSLNDVAEALERLNVYADKTIYNFGEMTRNIGYFTVAGVDLDTSVSAIKGLSNLAALQGVDSSAAARATYQISQALSTGTVRLMDWKSLENAGMAGKGFQEMLISIAKKQGDAYDKAFKKHGSFRESLAEGWLTTDVLLQALNMYSGDFGQDMTDQFISSGYAAELYSKALEDGGKTMEKYGLKMEKLSAMTEEERNATIAAAITNLDVAERADETMYYLTHHLGYTVEEAEELYKTMQRANEAAKEVTTFTKLVDAVKEAAQSGWSQSWEIIIGDIEEAKKVWTAVSDEIGGILGRSAERRNKILKEWKEQTAVWGTDEYGNPIITSYKIFDAIANFYQGIKGIAGHVKKIFTDTFGTITSKMLVDGTNKLLDLSQAFKDFVYGTDEAPSKLSKLTPFIQRVANAIASVVSTIKSLVTSAFGIIRKIIFSESFGSAIGTIIGLIGKLLGKIRDLHIIEKIASVVQRIAVPVINVVLRGFTWLIDMFGKLTSKLKENGVFDKIGSFFSKIGGWAKTGISWIEKTANTILNWFSSSSSLSDAVNWISDALSWVVNSVSKFFSVAKNWFKNSKVIAAIGNAFSWLGERFKAINFKQIFSGIGKWFADLWSKLREFDIGGVFQSIWEKVKVGVSAAIGFVKVQFSKVLKTFKNIDWSSLVPNIWNGIKDAMSKIFERIKKIDWTGYLNAAWSVIKNITLRIISRVKSFDFGKIFQSVWSKIKTGFSIATGFVKKQFSKFLETLKNINWSSLLSNIWSKIKDAASKIGPVIGSLFFKLWASLKNSKLGSFFTGVEKFFASFLNKISPIFSKIISFIKKLDFKDILSRVSGWFKETWKMVKSADFKGLANHIFTGLGAFFSNVWSWIKSKLPQIGKWFSTLGKKIWSGILSIVDWIMSGFSNLRSKVGSVKETVKSVSSKFSKSSTDAMESSSESFWSVTKAWLAKYIGSWLIPVLKFIGNIFKGIWTGLKWITTNSWSFLTDTLPNLIKRFKNTLTMFIPLLRDLMQIYTMFKTARLIGRLGGMAKKLGWGMLSFGRNMKKGLKALSNTTVTFNRQKTIKHVDSWPTAILKLSASVFIIAAALEKFSTLTVDQMKEGVSRIAIVAALLATFSGIMALLGKWIGADELSNAGKPLFHMAIAMAVIAGAIMLFDHIDAEPFKTGLKRMGIAIGIMTAAYVLVGIFNRGISVGEKKAGKHKGEKKLFSPFLDMAKAMLMMWAAIKLFSMLDIGELGMGLLSIAAVLTLMTTAMIVLAKYGTYKSAVRAAEGNKSNKTDYKIADQFVQMAKAMLITSVAVALLSKLKPKSLWIAVGAVAALMAIFTVVSASMAKFGSIKNGKHFDKNLLKPVMDFARAVLLIAGAVGIIIAISKHTDGSGTDYGLIAEAIGGIILIMAAMTTAMVFLAKFNNVHVRSNGKRTKDIVAPFLTFAAAVSMLSVIAMHLGKMDIGSWSKGVGGVVLLMASLTAALVLISKYGNNIDKGTVAMVTSIIMYIVTLAAIAQQLSTMSPGDIAKGFVPLVIMMGMLALVMKQANKVSSNGKASWLGVAMIVAIVGTMVLIGHMIKQLSTLDSKSLVASAASLGGLIAALGIVIYALTGKGLRRFNFKKALKRVLLIPILMASIAAVIFAIGAAMTQISWGEEAMEKGTSMIGKVGNAFGDFLKGIFKVFDTDNYAALGAAAVLIGVFGVLFGKIPGFALRMTAGIIAFVAGMTLVMAALGALSQLDGFEELIDNGIRILTKIGEGLGRFGGAMVEGFFDQAFSGLGKLGTYLSEFGETAKPFITEFLPLLDTIPSASFSKLATFAEAMGAFAGATKSIHVDGDFSTNTSFGATLNKYLPIEAGKSWNLSGAYDQVEQEYGQYAEGIKKIITAISDFIVTVSSLDTKQLSNAGKAVDVVSQLVPVLNMLEAPLQSGIFSAGGAGGKFAKTAGLKAGAAAGNVQIVSQSYLEYAKGINVILNSISRFLKSLDNLKGTPEELSGKVSAVSDLISAIGEIDGVMESETSGGGGAGAGSGAISASPIKAGGVGGGFLSKENQSFTTYAAGLQMISDSIGAFIKAVDDIHHSPETIREHVTRAKELVTALGTLQPPTKKLVSGNLLGGVGAFGGFNVRTQGGAGGGSFLSQENESFAAYAGGLKLIVDSIRDFIKAVDDIHSSPETIREHVTRATELVAAIGALQPPTKKLLSGSGGIGAGAASGFGVFINGGGGGGSFLSQENESFTAYTEGLKLVVDSIGEFIKAVDDIHHSPEEIRSHVDRAIALVDALGALTSPKLSESSLEGNAAGGIATGYGVFGTGGTLSFDYADAVWQSFSDYSKGLVRILSAIDKFMAQGEELLERAGTIRNFERMTRSLTDMVTKIFGAITALNVPLSSSSSTGLSGNGALAVGGPVVAAAVGFDYSDANQIYQSFGSFADGINLIFESIFGFMDKVKGILDNDKVGGVDDFVSVMNSIGLAFVRIFGAITALNVPLSSSDMAALSGEISFEKIGFDYEDATSIYQSFGEFASGIQLILSSVGNLFDTVVDAANKSGLDLTQTTGEFEHLAGVISMVMGSITGLIAPAEEISDSSTKLSLLQGFSSESASQTYQSFDTFATGISTILSSMSEFLGTLSTLDLSTDEKGASILTKASGFINDIFSAINGFVLPETIAKKESSSWFSSEEYTTYRASIEEMTSFVTSLVRTINRSLTILGKIPNPGPTMTAYGTIFYSMGSLFEGIAALTDVLTDTESSISLDPAKITDPVERIVASVSGIMSSLTSSGINDFKIDDQALRNLHALGTLVGIVSNYSLMYRNGAMVDEVDWGGMFEDIATALSSIATYLSASELSEDFSSSLYALGSALGEHVGTPFAEGISASVGGADGGSLTGIITGLLDSAVTAVENADYQSKFYSIGLNMGAGLAKGIRAGVSIVTVAASTLGSAALIATKSALKVQSPSKETYKVGSYFDKGLSGGITDYTNIVATASTELANTALNSVSSIGTDMARLLNNAMQADDTIRPVVDLSAAQSGYDRLRSMAMNTAFDMATSRRAAEKNASFNYSFSRQNGDVVDAVNRMAGKIETLSSDMRNMKVVMNSGALVGQIANDMSKKMASMVNTTKRRSAV